LSATEGERASTIRVLVVARREGVLWPGIAPPGEEGLTVECTSDLYRAVADFAGRPADIVVVELDALENSELQFVRIVRELSCDSFILGAFSLAHRAKAAEALKLGADACLLHPFYPDELVHALRRWADRARRRQSAGRSHSEHLASLARLAKGTAHEINNPLTTLSGWLQVMESETERPPEERRRLASMRQEADRIAKVVERLLAFGEERPAERAPVDLNDVLTDLLHEARARAPGVRIDTDLQADGAVVWGDEDQLKRACGILIDDALAAVNSNGTVRVRTRSVEGERLELSVRDDGQRIAAARLEEIFEPYAVIPRLGEAMSLAYPAAYGIFRSHGGEVTVRSDQERGTEFLVRLPRISTIP